MRNVGGADALPFNPRITLGLDPLGRLGGFT
jgi:hypothetical protein